MSSGEGALMTLTGRARSDRRQSVWGAFIQSGQAARVYSWIRPPSRSGSSPATCAPPWFSMRCGWRFTSASPAPTSRSCTTATLAAKVESAQYTSIDYTQTLEDHGVLSSIGSVGDAYDNATAESFVDSFKTELIADRVWSRRSQLELAVVEYVAWFNNTRLHEALGDRPPRELEELYAVKDRPTTPIR